MILSLKSDEVVFLNCVLHVQRRSCPTSTVRTVGRSAVASVRNVASGGRSKRRRDGASAGMQAIVGAAGTVVAEQWFPHGRSSSMCQDAYAPPGSSKGSNISQHV